MRILFVINTISRAGAETVLLELMRRCVERGHEAELFVMTSQGELIDRVPKGVRILNKKICPVSVLKKEGRGHLIVHTLVSGLRHGAGFKNLSYMAGNFIKKHKSPDFRPENLLWRMLSDGAPRFDQEYDLAVAFLEGASTYYVADHVRARKKAAFVHVDYGRAGYSRELDRGCYNSFDRIYPISEEVRESFLSVYPEYGDRTEVFENVIDTMGILERAKEGPGFSDDYSGMRLFTVGRLTPQKGYDVAIAAAAILRSRGLDFRWYVAGDGALREKLLEQIRGEGLEDDFILLGAVDNPYPMMRQCDIYVHATRFEGKSIAIREAKLLGAAVIATDTSGNRELITDGYDGLLCGTSAQEIADAIISLSDDDKLLHAFRQNAPLAEKEEGDPVGRLERLYGC